ncbi:MAG: YlmC/YmxH family sporulation protein [Clostridia bacterium]|nr:YlmC/YmxH family sporulation protein [Clostridia bacterium]
MYSLEEFGRKDIIDVENGCRIGFVRDIEFGEDGKADFLTVEKTSSKANPFKKGETVKISWSDIVVIGKETILVKNTDNLPCEPVKKTRLSDLF